MALDPLATTADLDDRDITYTNDRKAEVKLAAASAAVRDAAGSPISQVTSTVTLDGGHSPWLALPGKPVISVASVTVDGSAVTDWRLRSGSLHRACGMWSYCAGPSEVVVTYTHGLAEVPDDIVDLVCNLVAVALSEDEAHDPRIISEAIDDSRTGWQTGADTTVSVFELPERTRIALATRFGGGVYTTGVR